METVDVKAVTLKKGHVCDHLSEPCDTRSVLLTQLFTHSLPPQ